MTIPAMWRLLLLGLVSCASEAAISSDPVSTDSGQSTFPDTGGLSDFANRESPAPAAECTIILATSPAPIDCAATHGLMWCAGKGTNGCVACPYDPIDGGGVRRRLDCNQNAADGCEVAEGDQNCGACDNACAGGQHCVTIWAAAPGAFAPHCE